MLILCYAVSLAAYNDILNCLGTLFQIILHVLLFKLLNPPSPDHNFQKLCRLARKGKTFPIYNLGLMSYPCIKIHPHIQLSVSNLSHVLFIYLFIYFLSLFYPGTVLKPCLFSRNNPEYRLRVVAHVPFGAVRRLPLETLVLKFRS